MYKPFYVCLFIALAALLIYGKSVKNGFVSFDDNAYVYENEAVKNFDVQKLATGEFAANRHPVTMLQLAAVYAWFDGAAKSFHFNSLLLHILCSLAVYFFVSRLCGDQKVAAVAGVLFAVHPMHVESVAWVSSTKDLLYTLFYVLAIIAYLAVLEAKNKRVVVGLWIAIGLLFLLSLLSKAMAVTLPVSLLLIDYYKNRRLNKWVWLEKVPLVLIAVFIGLLAVKSQGLYIAETTPLEKRVLFAVYSIGIYLIKFFIPYELNAIYQNPGIGTELVIALIAVAGACFLLYRYRRKRFVVFGMGFFVLNVVLVLKVFMDIGTGVPVAERYTYLSYLGLCFIAGVGIVQRKQAMAVAGIWVIAIAFVAFDRTAVWNNNKHFWLDTFEKEPMVPLTNAELGNIYFAEGDYDSTLIFNRNTLAIQPENGWCYYNIAYTFYSRHDLDSVLHYVNLAIDKGEKTAPVYFLRAKYYGQLKMWEEGIANIKKAVELDSTDAFMFNEMGSYFYRLEKFDAAEECFTKAIVIDANLLVARKNLKLAREAIK